MHRLHRSPHVDDQYGQSSDCRRRLLLFAILGTVSVAGWGLGGCRTVEPKWDVPEGQAFTPRNYARSMDVLPAEVRRVAVLPIHSDEWRASDTSSVQEALLAELGKRERFEIIPVGRSALRTSLGSETVLSSAPLPADFLTRMQADFGADAVLFLDLTHFAPYQPIAIGLRAKLVRVADGEVIWSFDGVFDAAHPGVAVAARQYYMEQSRAAPPLDDATGIFQSPARFARFVGYSVFSTLPGREP